MWRGISVGLIAALASLAPLPTLASVTLGTANTTALSSGLVGYWTFDGPSLNWKTNTVSDVSGNGNTGALINMSTTTSVALGKIGQALSTVGGAGRMSVANSASINPNDTLTIAFWVKGTPSATAYAELMHKMVFSTAGWSIQQANLTSQIYMRVDTSAGINQSIGTISNVLNGSWHHIVYTLYSGVIVVYKDGVRASSGAYNHGTGFANSSVFTTNPYASQFLYAAFDDVRIYNRTLSAQEVALLYALGNVNAGHSSAPPSSTFNFGLTAGLVGYWTFDGPSLNWKTGTVADVSGNGNTGTLVSMSTTTSPAIGKIGQALKFDGGTSNVNLGNVALLTFTSSDFSICTWVYPTDNSGYRTIINKGNGTTAAGSQYELLSSNNSNQHFSFDVFIGASNDPTFDPAVHATNQWFYVCGVRSGSTNTLYKNGVSVASNIYAGTLNSSSNATKIGIAGSIIPFAGRIDDVRIYNRALSAQEVQQLYALGNTNAAHSNTVTLSTGLVGYWNFDGPSLNWKTNTVADVSGNGNTGSLVSMSTTTSVAIGKIGQALKFDGITSRVQTEAVQGPQSAGTWSAWVRLTNFSAGNGLIVSQYNGGTAAACSGGSSRAYLQFAYLSTGAWFGRIQQSSDTVYIQRTSNTGQISNNRWYHVVMTWDGGTTNNAIKLYVDGVRTDTTDGGLGSFSAPYSGTIPIRIGDQCVNNTPNAFVAGIIDDVRIYNRALSAQEVQQLYLMGK